MLTWVPYMLRCMCMQEAEALRAVMMVRRGEWELSRPEREVRARRVQRGGHGCNGCDATGFRRGGYGNSCKAELGVARPRGSARGSWEQLQGDGVQAGSCK